jgi:hypothetical protein
VVCEAIDQLQRAALDRARPELVVRVDRSGLNEHHPLVARLYQAVDRVLRPIVAAEERRATSHRLSATRAVAARDQVGLRALNDLLKMAFDQLGRAAVERGQTPADVAPVRMSEQRSPEDGVETVAEDPRGARSRLASRTAGTLGDLAFGALFQAVADSPASRREADGNPHRRSLRVAPGTVIEVETDPGLSVALRDSVLPEPGRAGHSSVRLVVRARVTAEPGARLAIVATTGDETAELDVILVRHRVSGWVREIARKSEDQIVEAEFDPELGLVTMYEGRREFRELERAARRAGYDRRRVAEYVSYRMLEVEAAANAVYAWAAEQILARRLPEERPQEAG